MSADEPKKPETTAKPDAQAKQPTPEQAAQQERVALLKAIEQLQRENKTLLGQVQNMSAEKLAELKAQNKELKQNLVKVQKELAEELLARKNPLDATGVSDKLQVLKSEVLAFCNDRKLDPALWKKLESL